jgi:phosphatidylserine/phosphatidylglycerophosphate/cardiolipin synthase-like enzyme
MLLACKGPGLHVDKSPEELMMCFLHESFGSKFLWIISPWVSFFKLGKRLVHYPYVSSADVVDIIEALVKVGVEVRVLTRCIDDALEPGFMRLIASVGSDGGSVPDSLRVYVREGIEEILGKINTILRLRKILKDKLQFDFRGAGQFGRLHTKLYINENSAVISSANFTWSGIAERGNWECLLYYKRVENETLYAETLSVAEAYFSNGARYEQCEELTIRKAMEYRLVDEPVVSLEDMARYLEVVKSRI